MIGGRVQLNGILCLITKLRVIAKFKFAFILFFFTKIKPDFLSCLVCLRLTLEQRGIVGRARSSGDVTEQ